MPTYITEVHVCEHAYERTQSGKCQPTQCRHPTPKRKRYPLGARTNGIPAQNGGRTAWHRAGILVFHFALPPGCVDVGTLLSLSSGIGERANWMVTRSHSMVATGCISVAGIANRVRHEGDGVPREAWLHPFAAL